MDPKAKFNLWYVVAAIAGVILLQSLLIQSQQVDTIPYSEFDAYLKEGRVGEIVVTENYIKGTLKPQNGAEERRFVTNRVESQLAEELNQYGVTYTVGYDDDGEVAIDYGLSGVPETFIIDAEGKVVARLPGEVRTLEQLRGMVAEAR